MTQPTPKSPRIIKKYPNRRLYDTVESRYITLNDIRQLVMDKTDFVVIDKASKEDITRAILLQVIADQENGAPIMSQDFLSQVIRAYGGAMQSFVGSYLDHSLQLFTQQAQPRERPTLETAYDPVNAYTRLALKNLEFWQAMQQQFFATMMGAKPRRRDSHETGATAARDAARE